MDNDYKFRNSALSSLLCALKTQKQIRDEFNMESSLKETLIMAQDLERYARDELYNIVRNTEHYHMSLIDRLPNWINGNLDLNNIHTIFDSCTDVYNNLILLPSAKLYTCLSASSKEDLSKELYKNPFALFTHSIETSKGLADIEYIQSQCNSNLKCYTVVINDGLCLSIKELVNKYKSILNATLDIDIPNYYICYINKYTIVN